MPKVFTSASQKIGETGENLACAFLVKQGFEIIERNYTQKWGEIDIVAKKDGKIHFVEVKSVSKLNLSSVNHETIDQYQPEDNMHPWKLKRLSRTIQTYILSNRLDDCDWQFDLIVIFIDPKTNNSEIKVVKDIIL